MKKVISIILISVMLLSMTVFASAQQAPASGGYNNEYGNISWTYDEQTKTLSVTGTGTLKYGGWSEESGAIEAIVLTDGITSISYKLFFDNTDLTSVTLPATAKTIGDYAFAGTSLTQIDLPDGLETIGKYAFAKSKISEIAIPETVKNIGEAAFANTDIESIAIPDGITEIAAGCFRGCKNLEAFTVPSSVLKIGSEAFANSGLKEGFEIPETVEDIGSDIINGTPLYDSLVDENGQCYLGTYLLDCDGSLAEQDIKEGTTYIANGIFVFNDEGDDKLYNVPATVEKISGYLPDFQYIADPSENPDTFMDDIEIAGAGRPEQTAIIRFAGTKSQFEKLDFYMYKTKKESSDGLLNVVTMCSSAIQYEDIVKDKWYEMAVDFCYANNYVAGMSETEFGVDTDVTRGMFITVLARMAGVDTNANDVETKFSDVAKGRYYTNAIKWANEKGVVAGVSSTEFAPDAPIQRQQLCTMLVNYIKKYDKTNIIKPVEQELTFTDAKNISDYAKESVRVCQRADIINGYENGDGFEFKPTDTATRAEAAQMLYKFRLSLRDKDYYSTIIITDETILP